MAGRPPRVTDELAGKFCASRTYRAARAVTAAGRPAARRWELARVALRDGGSGNRLVYASCMLRADGIGPAVRIGPRQPLLLPDSILPRAGPGSAVSPPVIMTGRRASWWRGPGCCRGGGVG
jgi:hypothetical protein